MGIIIRSSAATTSCPTFDVIASTPAPHVPSVPSPDQAILEVLPHLRDVSASTDLQADPRLNDTVLERTATDGPHPPCQVSKQALEEGGEVLPSIQDVEELVDFGEDEDDNVGYVLEEHEDLTSGPPRRQESSSRSGVRLGTALQPLMDSIDCTECSSRL